VFSVRLLSSGSISVDRQGTRLGAEHHHLQYPDNPSGDLQKEIDAAPTAMRQNEVRHVGKNTNR
jgi:hypothetical protein